MKSFIRPRHLPVFLIAGLALTGFVMQSTPGSKSAGKKPVSGHSSAKRQKKAASIAGTITWHNMTEGYKKAVREKKMLAIDVYTDWCYWCKVMDAKTYTDSTVIRKMNEYYVAVKFNPEVDGNHIIGSDTLSSGELLSYLNRGRGMPGYPMTYIWGDLSKQSTLAPYSGYIEANPFNEILNSHIYKDQQ